MQRGQIQDTVLLKRHPCCQKSTFEHEVCELQPPKDKKLNLVMRVVASCAAYCAEEYVLPIQCFTKKLQLHVMCETTEWKYVSLLQSDPTVVSTGVVVWP